MNWFEEFVVRHVNAIQLHMHANTADCTMHNTFAQCFCPYVQSLFDIATAPTQDAMQEEHAEASIKFLGSVAVLAPLLTD